MPTKTIPVAVKRHGDEGNIRNTQPEPRTLAKRKGLPND